jgi:ABC-type transport system involved in multi-copper enzyme maturation permease subunit
MKVRLSKLGLPMLAKDLREMAQRRQTYGVRVAFAMLMFLVSGLIFLPTYGMARFSPTGLLGKGGQLLNVLYVIELVGLCLFVPAIVSGALAAEKERNTLQLLFLTRLGPWTILIEKLLSRLVPVGTFLLVSLPLVFVAYLLGGLTRGDVEFAVLGLAATAFEVACLSLFCSAFCATSATAFVMSYVTMATLFVFPYLLVATFIEFELWYRRVTGSYPALFVWLDQPRWQPVVQMAITSTHGFNAELLFRQGIGPGGLRPFHRQFPPLCIMTMCGLFFLVLARLVLVPRMAPQPKHRIRRLFQAIDRILERVNNRLAKGIVFGRAGGDLPDNRPVAWRENRRGNLGRLNYLIRILLVLELPILLPTVLYVLTTRDFSFGALLVPEVLLWLIAFLVVFVRAAGLIAAEKARQTFDVLLATPLPLSALVGDKLRGLRRVMAVASVPILIHAVLVDFLQAGTHGAHVFETTVNLVILLNLAAQLAFLCGLWTKTQGRAVIAALSLFAAWCVIPVIFRLFADTGPWILYFCPIGGLLTHQFPRLGSNPFVMRTWPGRLEGGGWGFFVLIHYAIYAAIVPTLALVNRGLARRVLLRPWTFSPAPTHHTGLFSQDY